MASPLKRTASRGARTRPGEALEQRGLARAVGADDRDQLALRELEVDAEEGLGVAVEGLEAWVEQRGHG